MNIENLENMFSNVVEVQYPVITQEQYEYLINNSFPTGSQVLGGATEESDYDYVINQKDYYKQFNFYCYCEQYPNTKTGSVKCLYDNKIINILVTKTDIEYESWVYATNEYIRIVGNLKVVDKKHRVQLFDALQVLYLNNVE